MPVKVGVVAVVMPSPLEDPVSLAGSRLALAGVLGAVVSIVTASALEAALVLPATSVALAVTECTPWLKVELVIDQAPFVSAVALPRAVVPSVS